MPNPIVPDEVINLGDHIDATLDGSTPFNWQQFIQVMLPVLIALLQSIQQQNPPTPTPNPGT